MHTDPLGTSAWNALLRGRKLWILFPPGTSKYLVKAKHLMLRGEDNEAIDYFNNLVPRIKREYGDTIKITQFIQYPGETVSAQ